MPHTQFQFLKIVLIKQILQIAHGHFHGSLLTLRAVWTKFKSRIPQSAFRL